MKKQDPNDKKNMTAAKIILGITATAAICMNLNGCVYGSGGVSQVPKKSSTTKTETTTTEPEEVFSSEDNINQDVYGPPEDFDPSDNENTEVYGAPEYFDPTDNLNQDVYGPPEDFSMDGADKG